MTDLDRLRDAVVEAARSALHAAPAAYERLSYALAALDAHTAQRATAATVGTVEVRQAILWDDEQRQAIAIDESGLKDWWPGFRHIGFTVARVPLPTIPTVLGTTTLRLEPEAEG